MNAEPDASLAAHRKAAEINSRNIEGVEEIEDVVCKKLNGIRTSGSGGLAMTASVIAEEAMVRVQGWELRIPHGEVRTERIGKDEDRGGLGPREGIVDANVAEVGKRHGFSLLRKVGGGVGENGPLAGWRQS